MITATITTKGQITVPKAIRDTLGLKEGYWASAQQRASIRQLHRYWIPESHETGHGVALDRC